MAAYYNEFDPFAAAWLRQLIAKGLIAAGDVDERSIVEVKADDIKGYNQCHFFAGIGGWSHALRLALWNDDRPVWTGSCPCQPFSSAGKRTKQQDERHLWPHWARLIRECNPPTIFGEQVASAIAAGWWDDVSNDLEAQAYACAAAVLPACSVGRPHKRDRLWFVANSEYDGFIASQNPRADAENGEKGWQEKQDYTVKLARVSSPSTVAHAECGRRQKQRTLGESKHSTAGEVGQANQPFDDSAELQWIYCPDGKPRPVEPSIPLLAHGIPNRVGKLRGYGNAIVPQVAAEFIKATGLI